MGGAVLATALVAPSSATGELLPHAAFIVVAVAACVLDVATSRVPAKLTTLGTVSVFGGWVLVSLTRGSATPLLGALAGSSLFAGVVLVPHLLRPESLGFGDVKLAVVLGTILGPHGLVWAPVAALVAQSLQIVLAVLLGRRRLPFAPALVFATSVCLVIAGGLG